VNHVKILFAYDGSMFAEAAIEDMTRAGLSAQANVLILCVAEAGLPPAHTYGSVEVHSTDPRKRTLETAETLVEAAGNRLQQHFPEWTIVTDALPGSPAQVILETSTRWRPDLLILGSVGRCCVPGAPVGSVSGEVVRQAHCSVRIARTGRTRHAGPIKLVIGYDGTAESEAVLDHVARRSWPEHTEAHVVSVVEALVRSELQVVVGVAPPFSEIDEQECKWIRRAVQHATGRLSDAGLIVTATVAEGYPDRELIQEAERWNADSIFVGAHRMQALERRLLGSVSATVVRKAHCSVEVVRRSS
jgi:nucleotide-binding universal stress UspA family protein